MALELSDGFHFCIANDHVVLLDIHDGSYACLPPDADQAFKHLARRGKATEAIVAALTPLLEDGILWEHCGGHGLPGVVQIPKPYASVVDHAGFPGGSATNLAAIGQRLLDEILCRTAPFRAVVSSLRAPRAPARRLDDVVTLSALATYNNSRNWLGAQDRCLPWSIALVRILRAKGIDAKLVLGVRMTPWAAHAWAECDGHVLNDQLDHVLPYTPILAV